MKTKEPATTQMETTGCAIQSNDAPEPTEERKEEETSFAPVVPAAGTGRRGRGGKTVPANRPPRGRKSVPIKEGPPEDQEAPDARSNDGPVPEPSEERKEEETSFVPVVPAAGTGRRGRGRKTVPANRPPKGSKSVPIKEGPPEDQEAPGPRSNDGPAQELTEERKEEMISFAPVVLAAGTGRRGRGRKTVPANRPPKGSKSVPIQEGPPKDQEAPDASNATNTDKVAQKKKKAKNAALAAALSGNNKIPSCVGLQWFCNCTGTYMIVMGVCDMRDWIGSLRGADEEEAVCACEMGLKDRLRKLLIPDEPVEFCPRRCVFPGLAIDEDPRRSTLKTCWSENDGKMVIYFVCRICYWMKSFVSERTIDWAEKECEKHKKCGGPEFIHCTCNNPYGTPTICVPVDYAEEQANKIPDEEAYNGLPEEEYNWEP